MFALDTDTLTLLFRGHPRVTARMAATPPGEPVLVPVVVRAELLRGRYDALTKAADGASWLAAAARLAADESRLAPLHVLPVTATAAAHFDRLRGRKGFGSRRADLLIACITLAHDATLVTRNTQDFRTIPGLKLVNWAD